MRFMKGGSMKAYEVEEELTSLLESEATRIMDILIDMYKKKTRVNKSFNLLVDNLIRKEFKPYDTSILSKVTSLIPLDLMICPTDEWVFVTEKEYYSVIEEENVNIIKMELSKNENLIKDVSEKIIAHYKSDNLSSKNILEIIYHYIPEKELARIDSKVISYIIKSIVFNIDETYQVISINPLAINGL